MAAGHPLGVLLDSLPALCLQRVLVAAVVTQRESNKNIKLSSFNQDPKTASSRQALNPEKCGAYLVFLSRDRCQGNSSPAAYLGICTFPVVDNCIAKIKIPKGIRGCGLKMRWGREKKNWRSTYKDHRLKEMKRTPAVTNV